MRQILFILCSLCITFSYSQKVISKLPENSSNISYYIRIPNSDDVPQILSKSNKGVILKHANTKIQNVFNKYKIFEFIKAFPNTKTTELKGLYYIKTNSRDLIFELSSNHNTIFTYNEEIPQIKFLLETNDYGLAWNGEQKNLDLINAKQAWDYTTGNPNVLVGISDLPIKTDHEDLLNKVVGYTNTTTTASHGTEVAGVVAANTNNNIGLSAIGYNIKLLYQLIDGYNLGLPNIWNLYQSGAKIINGSWHYGNCGLPSQIDQLAINEMYNNGTTIIFAAGNTTTCGNSKDNPIYPASYDNVISVTSVGTQDVGFTYNGIQLEWRDRVENLIGNSNSTHHLNNLVDLAAPGFAIPVLTNFNSLKYRAVWGTSSATPHISGTIGLMLSVNSSLTALEVESILKLTSSNLDSILENQNYIDKMGAGRLDAAKAVEMAYKMAQPITFIEIKNRDFYRNWNFVLENAPYGIKINNQKFRDEVKIDFYARNYIELENTILEPNSIGSSILSIDSSIPLPKVSNSSGIASKNTSQKNINNIPFFDNSIFTLEYFLINNERVELDLTHHNGQGARGFPTITFNFNSVLDAEIYGYCNGTSVKYEVNEDYLKVISRGATTLADCGSDEETDFFEPVTGNIYMQQPPEKVYYEIIEDNKGLWLWMNESHKLFFTKTILGVNEFNLDKLIRVFPNPASDYLTIESAKINILKVSIFTPQGKEILVKTTDFDNINVSNLDSGIYFVKLKTEFSTVTKKILLQ